MAVPRRAFALMLVLIAVSATFALAMQGAVALRTAMAESGAMQRRSELRRDATSAAAVVLTSLTSGDPLRVERFGSSTRSFSSQAPAADDEGLPEMPPEMKQLLLGLTGQKNKQPTNGSTPTGSPGQGLTRTGGAYAALKRKGLPVKPLFIEQAGVRFRVTVFDGAGVLNINTAKEDQLTRFFRAKGVVEPADVALAQEILDWRDKDSVPRSRGAERSVYLRRGVSIRNGPFESIDELLYLPSMTRKLLESIRGELTIVGDGLIHAGSASKEVLLSAPDMTEQAAGRIMALREAGKLDSDALDDALKGLSQAAKPLFRLRPSSVVTLRLEPETPGPAFIASAFISDGKGVVGLNVKMASR